MSITPTFKGEVQFRRWSDSSTQGVQVTFGLPDSADLEPLKHKAGKRFMAVLVEIGDDEQPVQPRTTWADLGPKCKEALDLSDNQAFQEYVAEFGYGCNPRGAEAFIKEITGVASRKEFDSNPQAYRVFTARVRDQFQAWVRNR